jgi:hypothetical protein
VGRVVLALALALAIAPAASASQLIDRNANHVKLQVDSTGTALLTYQAHGTVRHVFAWGAVNAIAPTPTQPQVAFKLDYTGGWGKFRDANAWKGFVNTCTPVPARELQLHWLQGACQAVDGSYWAIQSWQRELPDYGVAPTPEQAAWELRLSHWTGDPATLTIHFGWSHRRFQQIFGAYSYGGQPVYGFRSKTNGEPLDTYGRNLYLDTYNSAYGPGWQRENSFLMHTGTGTFCYGFYPHGEHPSGRGEGYRATIIGPGVTPDVYWESAAPTTYDLQADLAANQDMLSLIPNDKLCRPN